MCLPSVSYAEVNLQPVMIGCLLHSGKRDCIRYFAIVVIKHDCQKSLKEECISTLGVGG